MSVRNPNSEAEMDTRAENIVKEFRLFPEGMSPFYRHLCEAITHADPVNVGKLKKVFPELVDLVRKGR